MSQFWFTMNGHNLHLYSDNVLKNDIVILPPLQSLKRQCLCQFTTCPLGRQWTLSKLSFYVWARLPTWGHTACILQIVREPETCSILSAFHSSAETLLENSYLRNSRKEGGEEFKRTVWKTKCVLQMFQYWKINLSLLDNSSQPTLFWLNLHILDLLQVTIGCKTVPYREGVSTQQTSKCHESTAHLGADQINSH